jgi:hypothetical protein
MYLVSSKTSQELIKTLKYFKFLPRSKNSMTNFSTDDMILLSQVFANNFDIQAPDCHFGNISLTISPILIVVS